MTIEKVNLSLTNNNHACTGVVMSCEETGRTIASFWHESDAEDVMRKVNDYDKLVEFVKYCKWMSSEECTQHKAFALVKELVAEE